MDLYREELMEYYKNPANRGTMESPTIEVAGDNPMCGDELHLQLLIKDGVIEDFKYDGEACAVSIVAASITSEEIIGKTIDEAKKFDKEVLLDLIGANLTTSRVKCATLILEALDESIKKYEEQIN